MKLSKTEKAFIKGRRKYLSILKSNDRFIGIRKKSAQSAGEKKISGFLRSERVDFKREYYFRGLYNTTKTHLLFFDFYLPDYNLCIEYDGEQHFSENKPQRQRENDFLKNAYCTKNNIHLLRISYRDFNNIESLICKKIDSISPIDKFM